MANVLLLREPSTDEPDRYEIAVKKAGYTPLSVPVLETVLTNQDALQRMLRQGPTGNNKINGVIITSARACEAWRAVVSELAAFGPSEVGRYYRMADLRSSHSMCLHGDEDADSI
jgi:uroporphyrinogen-III synthase